MEENSLLLELSGETETRERRGGGRRRKRGWGRKESQGILTVTKKLLCRVEENIRSCFEGQDATSYNANQNIRENKENKLKIQGTKQVLRTLGSRSCLKN